VGLSVKRGTFVAATATGNQAVTGVGFQGKVLLLQATRQTAHGTIETGGMALSVGAATSSTQRWANAIAADDAAATSNAGRRSSSTKCLVILASGAPTVNGECDFVSWDSDGFTINWTDAPAGAYLIHYYVLGGTDITDAKAGTFTGQGTTGGQAVTDPGFRPDFLMLAGSAVTTQDGNSATCNLFLGMASAGNQRAVSSYAVNDAAATMTSVSMQVSTQILEQLSASAGTETFRADISSFDSTGFTLSWGVTAGTQALHYLAIKGARHRVNVETNRITTTGTKATTGTGFTPKGLFATWWNRAAGTTVDTTQAKLGIGTSDGAAHGHVWARSRDNIADSEETHRSSSTNMIETTNDTGSTATTAGVVSSFDSDGFTLDWTAADGTAREFAWWAIGPNAKPITPAVVATSTVGITVRRRRRVAPATAALSTVTATTRRRRRVTGVAIANAGGVVVTPRRRKPVTGVAVSAVSATSAAPRRRRRVTAGVAAVSTVSVVIRRRRRVAAAVAGVSAVAVTTRRRRRVAAAAAALSTVTATTRRRRRVSAQVQASSTVVATAQVSSGVVNVTPAITAVAVVGITVLRRRRLVVGVACTSSATANAWRVKRVTGLAVAGVSSVTVAGARRRRRVAVGVAGVSSTAVTTRRRRRVAAGVTCSSSATVTTRRRRRVAASVAGVSSAVVTTRRRRRVSLVLTAQSSAQVLARRQPRQVLVSVSALAGVTAVTRRRRRVTVGVFATSSATAGPRRRRQLELNVTGSSTVTVVASAGVTTLPGLAIGSYP